MTQPHRPDQAPAGLPAPPDGERGLTAQQAAERLERDGPNQIVPERRQSRLRRLLRPLSDPMVVLLLVAAPTYAAIGDNTDAIITFAAIVPIAAVGWVLEARAERTLEQLRRLTAPTATVWRDGRHVVVPAEQLVAGDLVWLREGDVVPADGVVVQLTQLLVDESALTGESLPVAKAVGAQGEEGVVLAGTTVLSGRAIVRLTATGPRTRYGAIGTLVAQVRQPPTPLQRAVGRLVRAFGVVAAVFCTAVIAAELARGAGWGQAVIAGVSLAIAAVPEEFPMVYTLYLALGAWRLARDRALVRRLPGVETLGSTTVICTDKTGTLTQGRLAVAGLSTSAGQRRDGGELTAEERALLEAGVLASEPDPFDPLDVAVVANARQHGIDVEALHAAALVTDHPFDPRDKYLTHTWRLPDGTWRVAAKGSIEGILAHAHADPSARLAAQAANQAFAADGMRVIAVASGTLDDGPTGSRPGDEAALWLLGLVAFSDPVREGVAAALAACRSAGIRVVMITGDHPATAHAVAEGLDLPHGDQTGADLIATGDDLDTAGPGRLDELAATANVFARTRPEQKHRLVRALRRQGQVVAMTGDGINDAPALREADIGVAMGQRGTEVAREAATMVLLDDNFATIVAAVQGGRRIFDSLRRAFAYLVAFHPPLLVAALVIPLIGQPLLLLPVHLVLLELLLHPVVSLVFQADPPADDLMTRPPRKPGSGLAGRTLWRPLSLGLTLAAGVVSLYLAGLGRSWPVEQARALAFATLLAGQLLLLFVERSPQRPLWRSGPRLTRTLAWVTVALTAAIVAAVYLPPLAALLKLSPFPPVAWLVVAAVAAAATLWSEPLKREGRT
jgi:Ca2+-transporting ATPase